MPTHCLSGRCLQRCGSQYGFRSIGGCLSVKKDCASAIFVSKVYDSGREGTEWNHLLLDIGRDAMLELYVWVFDRIDEEDEIQLQRNVGIWFRTRKADAQYSSHYRNMLVYGNAGGR